MKFMLRKVYRILSLSFIISLAAVAYVSAATEVYNTSNNPLFITNSTWDQRLNTLQTTLQTQSANISTFLSRFGWNGTYTFSQGFELLYNDVHNLASSTSQSDILTAFNREFVSGQVTSGFSTKRYIYRNMTGVESIRGYLNGSDTGSLVYTIDSNLAHVDSDIHSSNVLLGGVLTDTGNISSTAQSIFNLENSNLPSIKVSASNMEVDLYNIRSNVSAITSDVDSIDAHTTGIYNTVTSYIPDIYSDLNILQEFFADSTSVANKRNAEISSDTAIDEFTGLGGNAVTPSDYVDISSYVSDVKTGFSTGNVRPYSVLNILSQGSETYPWQWFSQDTYNSINPQPKRGGSLNSDMYLAMYEDLEQTNYRKSSSDTPLLDAYNLEISQAVFK